MLDVHITPSFLLTGSMSVSFGGCLRFFYLKNFNLVLELNGIDIFAQCCSPEIFRLVYLGNMEDILKRHFLLLSY